MTPLFLRRVQVAWKKTGFLLELWRSSILFYARMQISKRMNSLMRWIIVFHILCRRHHHPSSSTFCHKWLFACHFTSYDLQTNPKASVRSKSFSTRGNHIFSFANFVLCDIYGEDDFLNILIKHIHSVSIRKVCFKCKLIFRNYIHSNIPHLCYIC